MRAIKKGNGLNESQLANWIIPRADLAAYLPCTTAKTSAVYPDTSAATIVHHEGPTTTGFPCRRKPAGRWIDHKSCSNHASTGHGPQSGAISERNNEFLDEYLARVLRGKDPQAIQERSWIVKSKCLPISVWKSMQLLMGPADIESRLLLRSVKL